MKKILVFTHYYVPGYKAGGPIRSIANMVARLSGHFNFFIVTSDRDSFDEVPYPNIKADCWVKQNNAHVMYTSAARRTIADWVKILRQEDWDIIYLNSFFDMKFSFQPLVVSRWINLKRRKIVIAPRGEFSEGALNLKSHKKKIFLSFVKLLGIYRDVTWQATTTYEENDIINTINPPKDKVVTAPNISWVPGNVSGSEPRFLGTLKIVTVSRISPIKNLDFSLQVLKAVSCNVEFNIYGPIGDKIYWSECEKMIKLMPQNVKVNYRGTTENSEISSVLQKNHLFFLPTKGENYGHAIAEAFMAGIPVLISDNTPWRNLAESDVGWDLSLNDFGEFVKRIELCFELLQSDRYFERRQILSWIEKKLENERVIKANIDLFKIN